MSTAMVGADVWPSFRIQVAKPTAKIIEVAAGCSGKEQAPAPRGGWTHAEVGTGARQRDQPDVPPSAVERSERNVSIDNVARIAKALQVEPGSCSRTIDPTYSAHAPICL
jgi:hypothetical protein